MSRFFVLALLALWCVIAQAQWVSFNDETKTRFIPTQTTMTDNDEKDFAVADFDGDGFQDVVVAMKVPFSVVGARPALLFMNEGGVLTDRTAELAPGFLATPVNARDVYAGDLNGDNLPDLVLVNTFGDQPNFYLNLGETNGQWQGFQDESATRFPTLTPLNQPDGPQFCAVAAGDVNGDGFKDLFFSNYTPEVGTTDVLLINNGTGRFTDETTGRLGDFAQVAFGTGAEFHDVDGDGDLDLVKMSTLYDFGPFSPSGAFILYNNGTGVFDQFPFTRLPGNSVYMFTSGFLNDDALLDFYIVSDGTDQVDAVTTVQPNGPVTFTARMMSSPRTASFGGNVKFADIDNDGDLDAGVAPVDVDIANCGQPIRFALLRNPGNGQLEDPWPNNEDQNIHQDPHDFMFMDVNNDGLLDILMGLCVGWKVFIQRGPCEGDCALDQNGVVDMEDLLAAVALWREPGGSCNLLDLNGDGNIHMDDLTAILNLFGPCD